MLPKTWVDVATIVGGLVSPFALVFLIATYLSQRRELRETRVELARQATAQEASQRAVLASQLVTRLPVTQEVLLRMFWAHLRSEDQAPQRYDDKDLGYTFRNIRVSGGNAIWGSDEAKHQEYLRRGVVDAVAFAESELVGLISLANAADETGALRALVENALSKKDFDALRERVRGAESEL